MSDIDKLRAFLDAIENADLPAAGEPWSAPEVVVTAHIYGIALRSDARDLTFSLAESAGEQVHKPADQKWYASPSVVVHYQTDDIEITCGKCGKVHGGAS